jgi:hypothetical protein
MDNKPLNEQEQKQLIEIMQIFMQLPNRDTIELHFYADASGGLYNDGEMINHFHDLEEGVHLMRWYANPEKDEEE